MRLSSSALVLVVATAIAPVMVGAAGQPVAVTPAEINWQPGPPGFPPGLKMAVLSGDPSKAGSEFSMRLKMPDGYVVKPHRHTADEHITVLSGTLWIGYGQTMKPASMKRLPAGSYFYLPKGSWHYVKAQGETVLEEDDVGPAAGTIFSKAM